jgi:HAD superfamily hydrolase (TIGR01509 family)
MMKSENQMPRLVVFDLDGVILNSEPLHEAAKRRIFAKYGIPAGLDLSWSVGRPNSELWGPMVERYRLPCSAKELERMQYEQILSLIRERNVPLSDGLPELLRWLRQENVKIGLASSSDRFYVDRILEYFALKPWFDAVKGGDEAAHKKPAPDVYTAVLKAAGVPAGHAVAVEDTKAGIEAASAAGLRCVGYRNPTSGMQELDRADWIVETLSGIPGLLKPA